MMVVQNLTTLEISNSFQINQLQYQYLCCKLYESLKDTHIYIDDIILQDGNQSAQCILKNLLQVAKDMLKYLLKDDAITS